MKTSLWADQLGGEEGLRLSNHLKEKNISLLMNDAKPQKASLQTPPEAAGVISIQPLQSVGMSVEKTPESQKPVQKMDLPAETSRVQPEMEPSMLNPKEISIEPEPPQISLGGGPIKRKKKGKGKKKKNSYAQTAVVKITPSL